MIEMIFLAEVGIMSGKRSRSITLLFLLVTVASLGVTARAEAVPSLVDGDLPSTLNTPRDLASYAKEVAQSIDMDVIKDHVQYLSSLRSRCPGTEGYYKAAEYIRDKFLEYALLNVSYQEFGMAMPVSYGANLEVLSPSISENITLEPFLPNVVAPPTGDYEGRLVYAGLGSYSEFAETGMNVSGAIAMLEYASGRNWVNAFAIGCQAVIFIESNATTVYGNLMKTASVAVNLPRYYITRNDADKLLELVSEGPVSVRIESKVVWEKIPAMNVLGFVKGTAYPDQTLLLIAHFDSFSIIPGVAPGANEAQGVAALLELARFYSKNPPARTVMFLAVSGHWQSYYGMREFMEEYYFGNSTSIGSKIRLAFYLDFYTLDSDAIVVQATGPVHSFTGPRYAKYTDDVAKLIFTLGSPSFNSYLDPATPIMKYEYGADSITSVLEEVFGDGENVFFKVGDQIYGAQAPWVVAGGTTWGAGGAVFVWDGELLMGTGGLCLAITSGSTSRILERTPLDTFHKVNFRNLNHVLNYAFNLIFFFANAEKGIYDGIPTFSVSRYDPNTEAAFIKLHVQVLEYDQVKTGWYKPVPGALVLLYQGASGYGTYVLGQVPNTQIIEIADENGVATFNGLRSAFIYMGAMFSYNIEGYMVDPEAGNLLYGPNQGSFGLAQFPSAYTPNKAEEHISVSVLKAGTIALFEVYTPLELPSGGWRTPIGQTTIMPLDAQSYSIPFFYGSKSDVTLAVSAVYAQPDTPVIIEYTFPGKLLGVLRNASETSPMGEGYSVGLGERLIIDFTSYRVALDTWLLDESRLTELGSYYVYSAGGKAEHYHSEAARHLRVAEEALRNQQYDKVFGEAWRGWSYEAMAYYEVKRTTIDAVVTACFFIALAIPFAFLFERLTFSFNRGWYRLGAILGIASALIALLAIMHPGFVLASNILMVVLGTAIIFLLLPVIAVIFSEVRAQLKQLRESLLGLHATEISTAGAIMMAFSVGTSHQRKRRFRTALTQVTVILITFALVSMVSVSTFSQVIRTVQPLEVPPSYSGLLNRDTEWQELSQDQFNTIYSAYGDIATIAPRVWWFPPYLIGQTQSILFWLTQESVTWNIDVAKLMSRTLGLKGRNGTCPVYAVWGLSPEEANITGLRVVEGRWVEPGDMWVVLLTVEDARSIGVSVGDTVEYYGSAFTVKGLVDANETYVSDIDGEPITPLSYEEVFYEIQSKRQVTNYGPLHLKPYSEGRFIIVPYQIAIDMGGSIISIAMGIDNKNVAQLVATELADKLGLNVYLSSEGSTVVYRKGAGYSSEGFEMIIIPLIIGALTIASTLTGNIFERIGEMSVFSFLGMNPMQIAGVFLAESLVTALVGAVIGYLVGVFAIYVGVSFGAVGTVLLPNYSSSYVLIAVSIAIVATLGVSSYPLYKSAKLVTPSLERKWKIPKPKGNRWEIPMPFLSKSESEVLGIFEYFKEYLHQFSSERVGTFMVGQVKGVTGVLKGAEVMDLTFNVTLAPYEQGISQEVIIRARWSHRVKAYSFELDMTRLTGPTSVWQISNTRFVDAIRKQLLTWQLLPPEGRDRYIAH